jgi:hypothetical protein
LDCSEAATLSLESTELDDNANHFAAWLGQAALKTLLIAKSALEVATGLVLALSPSIAVSILLGTALDASVGTVVARIGGAALVTIGIACWLARNDGQSPAATGLIVATLFYDASVVVILLWASLGIGLSGIGFCTALVLRAGLGGWCLVCLSKGSRRQLLT